jgi:hypothetical protein
MAAVALNTFRTIRVDVGITEATVYTCPIGVSSVVILSQVTNTDPSNDYHSITAIHSRSSEPTADYKFANNVVVPPNDGVSLIPDGRMVLETGDSIKVFGSSNGSLNLILSVLETAKS